MILYAFGLICWVTGAVMVSLEVLMIFIFMRFSNISMHADRRCIWKTDNIATTLQFTYSN